LERLTSGQQSAALRFLRDAYAPRDFNDFVAFLLVTLPTVIRSEVTSYHQMEPYAQRSRNWVVPEQPPERHQSWLRVMHEHPMMTRYLNRGGSQVELLSDFVSARKLRNMALYSEHYGPLGRIRDVVPIFWGSEQALNAIGLHRATEFGGRDKAIGNFLRLHLIEAHANALEITKMKCASMRLQKVLDASARALVVLKRGRSIEFATYSARKWIRDYFGGASVSERLPETLDLWVRQHDSGLRQILELRQPRYPLVIGRENRRLIVRLLSGDEEILLLLEEQTTSLQPDSLSSLGLTHRESEVLAHMANGCSKARIAHLIGTSPRTVDAHVQNIMNSLGVSSSIAAAAKAFQASRLALHDTSNDEAAELRQPLIRTASNFSSKS
jgi:DNA-binding CsgD family transcriptional regulator